VGRHAKSNKETRGRPYLWAEGEGGEARDGDGGGQEHGAGPTGPHAPAPFVRGEGERFQRPQEAPLCSTRPSPFLIPDVLFENGGDVPKRPLPCMSSWAP